MSPAFSSQRHAVAFASLLAVVLALPALYAWTGWAADRQAAYANVPVGAGEFRWIQSQIYGQTNALDMVFAGSSRIMFDVDAPYVKAQLSARLGRPADVSILSWPGAGYDTVYYVLRDLLDHRRVHTVVVDDEYCANGEQPYPDGMHKASTYWYTWDTPPATLEGLPWIWKLRLYAVAVIGTPRQVATHLHPDTLPDLTGRGADLAEPTWHAGDVMAQLGSVRARYIDGWDEHFSVVTPPGEPPASEAVVYSEATRSRFDFGGPATPIYQQHFARLIAALCREHGTQLVLLHLPVQEERDQEKIPVRATPEEIFGAEPVLVGIPGARLYRGVGRADFLKLFVDTVHMNENGQAFFTRAITPSLISLYAAAP